MKALICESCLSNDLVMTNGFLVCQYCDSKYTPDKSQISAAQSARTGQPLTDPLAAGSDDGGELLREIAGNLVFTFGMFYVYSNKIMFISDDKSKVVTHLFSDINTVNCSFIATFDIEMKNSKFFSYNIGNKALTKEWVGFVNTLLYSLR